MHFSLSYANIIKLSLRATFSQYAAVAQLDRVFGYEPKGRGFESLQPYQKRKHLQKQVLSFLVSLTLLAPSSDILKEASAPLGQTPLFSFAALWRYTANSALPHSGA